MRERERAADGSKLPQWKRTAAEEENSLPFSSMTVIAQSIGYRTRVALWTTRGGASPPFRRRLGANRRTDNVRTSTRSIDTSGLASSTSDPRPSCIARARTLQLRREAIVISVSSIMQGIKLQRPDRESPLR